ncbi:hypothetical protein Acid345_0445 [Candidatus Koribacter versatilis Ellin345]|uniref:TonB-dependent transporter Oar-like beta-barrel domain-containing protein n=1 Tax=Koribacter versatilis (strain Ellin345) TaxID=204669 RepID=Q1IUK0_KORVE|nr:hypothetical protein Acid345_0445 [Candidatus Koribacter versatilis Ellin345]
MYCALTRVPELCLRAVHRSRFAILCALVLFFSAHVFGQEATVVGTVTDPTGANVPNVTITITHIETGQVRNVTTNSEGQFAAAALPIGHYNITAQSEGFGVAQKTNVALNVGDRTRIDFALAVGSTKQTVTVEANAVQVQTQTGEVSTVIDGKQVAQLSTNGRSVYTLYALTPGASSVQGDFITPTPVSGDSNVSINGQRPGHNLQILDGGENLDRGGSSASVMPSLEAIAEFTNMTSNYSAEYGLSSAATITTAVKSGTNRFHASAWEFLRNDALDARNYFNPAPAKVAELRYNNFGFNVGGQVPLWKDHPTFFFYNQEWRRLVQGGQLNQTVPLASAYPDANGTGTGAVIPTTLPNGDPNIITVPTGIANFGANCSGAVRASLIPGQPFPANTIPDCLIDPNSQSLLKAGIFPLPTNGVQFQGGNNSPTNVTEEIVRIDHQFSSKFSIFGHWIAEQVSQTYGTTQWSGDNVPTISDVFGNPSFSGVIHTTYTISPTLLNEASFNYNGNRIHIIPQGLVSAPGDFTFNRLFTGPNDQTRIPSIALSGSTGTNYTSNWTPWNNAANDYQVRDDVTWSKGAHQLKMGGSWALYTKVQDAFANTQGNFSFNGGFSGNDFADFLLGYAQQYTEDAVKISGNWNNVSWAAYVQDNWRVTHRLTLNLGLRWDGVPHTYEANNQSSNFYRNLYDPANAATFDANGNICSANSVPACPGGPSPGLGTSSNPILSGVGFYVNGIGIGGLNGVPNGLVNNHWAAFGPRLGFAYDLTGQGKSVVRGGFGIMYERIQGNDMYNGAVNPPNDLQPLLNSVSLSNPGYNIKTGNSITAAALPVLPLVVSGIDSENYKLPVNYQYSFGFQQSLGEASVLGISYVGSQSRHQNDYRQINLPAITSLPALLASNGAGINQQMPYLGFGDIRLAENEANASYNSLQVDLRGNLKRDFQYQFGYTWSKAIDAATSNGSGGDLNNVTNPYVGWQYDKGPSPFDRTHIAFANFVYSIPLFNNNDSRAVRTILGGWQVSGIVTMESGAPLAIGLSGSNVSSLFNGGFVTNSGNRPNVNGAVTYPQSVNEWFDTSAFSAPTCTTGPDCWGDLGHNTVRGPGRDNWNLSLFKSFTLNDRGSRIEFRADSFNTWNHTQFKGDYNNGGISTNFGSGNFGAVTAAFDPREFQFGLKLVF